MAAPILPSLFPHPPLAPHHQLYFPPPAASVACWNLPPPPVQFYPTNNVTPHQLQSSIVGVANFNFSGSGPGFRGRGGYYHQRGVRGRGRGRISQRRHASQNQGVVKKNQRPAEFSCKVCNKEYRSEESFQIHLQSHRKCSLCDFQAVPRVLKEHELLHFLPDELKLTSPEDIKKWREDRRKNYPTAENIAKRKASDEEKKARGEVARTPLYRYIKRILGDEDGGRFNGGGKWKRGRGRGRRRGQRGGYRIANCHEGGLWRNKPGGRFTDKRSRSGDHTAARTRRSESESIDLSSGLTPESQMDEKQLDTSGKVNSLDGCDLQGEKEFQKGIMNAIMVDVASVAAAASASPGADAKCSSQQDTSNDHKQEVSNCEGSLDLTNACDLSQKDNHQQPNTSGTAGRKRKWAEGGRNRRDAKRKKKKILTGLNAVKQKKPTLLEMLLAPEIRREQNAILQCIHHVIKEDFFGLNS